MRTNGDDYSAGRIDAERYVQRHGPTAAETHAEYLQMLAADSEAYIGGFTTTTRQLARRIRGRYAFLRLRRAIRAYHGVTFD